ncbi:MAG: preprotein translocase subunit SecY [Clostridiales bacterium]|nr:preprotein translocase subunit SecY [Clostridiales bacterium]
MFQTLINAFKNPEVRKKILITIGLLILFRIGCWLPIPGLNVEVMKKTSGTDTLLGLLSAVTGSALANGAFLAIGISPYINASIIVQLLTVAIKKLEEWSKQGDEGKKKINTVTRVVTFILAIVQAVGITINWATTGGLDTAMFSGTFLAEPAVLGTMVASILVAGSMFTMWLGDRITENGVGNGISLLIYVGILSTTGLSIIAVIGQIFSGNETAIWELLGFLLMAVLIFGFIVFVDLAERKIPVQYAKQIKGRKQYGGQSTFIPLKVNASGVMPIIFSTAIITFPQMLGQLFWNGTPFYFWWNDWMTPNGSHAWLYAIIVALLILAFSYFYAQMQFNPEEVSRNIQQYGGFIPGIRPGAPTLDYLKKVTKRVTFFGAVYLTLIALVPSVLFSIFSIGNATLVNAMTSTGMLIIVSVALEFDKQLQSLMMMKHYKGFLK